MVNEGGVYYADIPVKHSDGTPIQGLTMNNYVWDALHYNLFYGSNQTDNNWQTYDYNEFTVINDILQNTQGLENEDIIFSFKYKETVDRTDSNLGESTYYKDSDTNNPNRDKDYRKWLTMLPLRKRFSIAAMWNITLHTGALKTFRLM